MSVILKKELVCKICKKIKNTPVLMPCSCVESICKEHSVSIEKIRCQICKKTFSLKNIQLQLDNTTQAILKENAHLTYDGKNACLALDKLLAEMSDVVKEFQAKIVNFSLTQSSHFLRIKRDIEKEIERIMNASSTSSRISRNERYKETGLGR